MDDRGEAFGRNLTPPDGPVDLTSGTSHAPAREFTYMNMFRQPFTGSPGSTVDVGMNQHVLMAATTGRVAFRSGDDGVAFDAFRTGCDVFVAFA